MIKEPQIEPDHNVYILGAGFSLEAGLPLIADFLNTMRESVEWLKGTKGYNQAAMTQATAYEHIVVDEAGTPLIEGMTTKVVELVLDVLAYYWDHKEELDRDIERRLERVEEIRREVGPSQLVERLKAKGLLS